MNEVHYFNSFVLIAQQAGQAVVLGHLSLSVCVSVYNAPIQQRWHSEQKEICELKFVNYW
jgi:hypothetical protein